MLQKMCSMYLFCLIGNFICIVDRYLRPLFFGHKKSNICYKQGMDAYRSDIGFLVFTSKPEFIPIETIRGHWAVGKTSMVEA